MSLSKIIKQKGFTLIELLIAVAIISILGVMAIPVYQDYTRRARFAEVIDATGPYKTSVSLGLQQGVAMDNLDTGANDVPPAPAATENLASLTVEDGVIIATATPAVGSYTYILTPNLAGTNFILGGTCLAANLCPI